MFRLTPTIKNLIILNVAVFALQFLISGFTERLAMYRVTSDFFQPYQFLTYMFAHSTSSLFHIIFNMLMLAMLGVSLEMVWGPKKFLIFYIVAGMGSGLFYAGIGYLQSAPLKIDLVNYQANPSVDGFTELVDDHKKFFGKIQWNDGSTVYEFLERYETDPVRYEEESVIKMNQVQVEFIDKFRGSVIGASGAVYGILMAFGMLFPERQLMLLIPPIPIKAKYFVLILGGMALYFGLKDNPGDQVAHFVHLGGMVVAFIMIKFF